MFTGAKLSTAPVRNLSPELFKAVKENDVATVLTLFKQGADPLTKGLLKDHDQQSKEMVTVLNDFFSYQLFLLQKTDNEIVKSRLENDIGTAYFEYGDAKEAIRWLEKAILCKTAHRPRINLAQIFITQDRHLERIHQLLTESKVYADKSDDKSAQLWLAKEINENDILLSWLKNEVKKLCQQRSFKSLEYLLKLENEKRTDIIVKKGIEEWVTVLTHPRPDDKPIPPDVEDHISTAEKAMEMLVKNPYIPLLEFFLGYYKTKFSDAFDKKHNYIANELLQKLLATMDLLANNDTKPQNLIARLTPIIESKNPISKANRDLANQILQDCQFNLYKQLDEYLQIVKLASNNHLGALEYLAQHHAKKAASGDHRYQALFLYARLLVLIAQDKTPKPTPPNKIKQLREEMEKYIEKTAPELFIDEEEDEDEEENEKAREDVRYTILANETKYVVDYIMRQKNVRNISPDALFLSEAKRIIAIADNFSELKLDYLALICRSFKLNDAALKWQESIQIELEALEIKNLPTVKDAMIYDEKLYFDDTLKHFLEHGMTFFQKTDPAKKINAPASNEPEPWEKAFLENLSRNP